jgi:hypothetical protein
MPRVLAPLRPCTPTRPSWQLSAKARDISQTALLGVALKTRYCQMSYAVGFLTSLTVWHNFNVR